MHPMLGVKPMGENWLQGMLHAPTLQNLTIKTIVTI